ncbi:MAG: ribbon-helix-helix protein, CopG family [Gemmatimonadetes bacterium]|nr:ribbon-helix-helix protein, CopG family [Gemmatimonadota bacterium]
MIKVTFTLDEETASYLDRTAERLRMSKSRVVREAIRIYGEQAGRLSSEERARLLELFAEVTARIPDRPRAEVEQELDDVRTARKEGGRGSLGPR